MHTQPIDEISLNNVNWCKKNTFYSDQSAFFSVLLRDKCQNCRIKTCVCKQLWSKPELQRFWRIKTIGPQSTEHFNKRLFNKYCHTNNNRPTMSIMWFCYCNCSPLFTRNVMIIRDFEPIIYCWFLCRLSTICNATFRMDLSVSVFLCTWMQISTFINRANTRIASSAFVTSKCEH